MKPADFFDDYHFKVSFRMSPCDRLWQLPESGNVFNRVYTIDVDKKMVIEFKDVDVNDCPFALSLWNMTAVPSLVNANHVTLVQPTFSENPVDSRIV